MANFITWELRGNNELIDRLARIIPQLQPANRDLARRAGQIITLALKKYAPVGIHYQINDDKSVVPYRPETLKKSIIYRTYDKGSNRVDLKVYAAEHVKYVINPTKAHWIRAKNKRFLRFYWPNAPVNIVERFGGNVVFFQQVWHPGTAKNEFHIKAYQSVEAEMQQLLTQYGATVIEMLGGQQGRFIF